MTQRPARFLSSGVRALLPLGACAALFAAAPAAARELYVRRHYESKGFNPKSLIQPALEAQAKELVGPSAT